MKSLLKSYSASLVAILLAACGESTTENVTNINQMGMDVVESVKELPKCEKDNEGEIAWVKGENTSRVCVDGKWFATKESVRDTVIVPGGKDTVVIAGDTVYMDGGDFSCTTKELKDKSGIKIICNGDSIGVVLNGEKGEQGLQGEKGDTGKDGDAGVGCTIAGQSDTTLTIKCGDKSMTMNVGAGGFSVDTVTVDSEKVVTNIASLEGYTQKGPFLKGSTVYLYELSDGRTLRQTNGNFMSYITGDDGRYRFNARDLISQYAMVVVDGNYRNEVTGKKSERPIRLRAITDVTARSSANVNLLTNLEYERVYYLVTQKKMKVRNAKKQAQAEIFKAFHIDTTGFKESSEDLDVFGKTDADAALLAISIMLQGDRDETDLTVLLTEISDDLATDGKWDDSTTKKQIAADMLNRDLDKSLAVYRNNVRNWGLSATVPDFEKFIRRYAGAENGLGVCGSESVPVGTVKNVTNVKSAYYASSYTGTENMGGKTRFICVDADSAKWRIATDIEKDTMGWGHSFDEGAVKNGRVNANLTYVYQNNNWRLGTSLDGLLVNAGGKACLKDGDTSAVKYNDEYYVCTANTDGALRGWKKAPDIYNDTYESREQCSKSGKYGDGTILAGRVNTDYKYVCDAGEFRLANDTEMGWNRGCVSYIRNASVMFDGQYSYYKCSDNGWVYDFGNLNTGTITDSRDNKKYKTIGIKTQVWMAENLNFVYEPEGVSGTCLSILGLISGFGNWTAFNDKLDIGTTMTPDSGASPIVIRDGKTYAEATMHIGPEPEWSEEAAQAGTLKYPSAGIAMYFAGDKRGVNFNTLGIKSLRVTMKASGPIRMAVLNEKTVEVGAEPGVYVPNSTGYVTTTYDLTPYGSGFTGFDDSGAKCAGGIPDWACYNDLPSGNEIREAVTGLSWEVKDAKGADGSLSIKAIEFLDANGVVVHPSMITGVNVECYDTYTYTDDGSVYGRYYTWGAAMDGLGLYSENSKGCGIGQTCTIVTPARGVCPEGWHIPTRDEWATLYSAIGQSANALQATDIAEWPGATDAYGFSALPAGYFETDFSEVGSNAGFWSATEDGSANARFWRLKADGAALGSTNKAFGYSVRCVKD